jgi:ketosteroid isomerase-like protein
MELFSEKDFDNLVSYFTPDATLMFPGKDNIQGKDGSYNRLSI